MDNALNETLKRIKTHRGVIGIIIVNNNGELITSTLDKKTSAHYAQLTKDLVGNAIRCVRNLDSSNELIVFRMGTKKNEIIITPNTDFTMVIIQNCATELTPDI